MDWRQLDTPTRAGFAAGVIAVVGMIVPPIGITCALVAMAFSGVGWRRSHQRGEANPVARFCLLGSLALVVLVVGGSALYAAAN